MPDPLIVTFPGKSFKRQMLIVQSMLYNSVNRKVNLPIAEIMKYVNLTESNQALENKLNERGDLIPDGDKLKNHSDHILNERLYDTGDQLKEVYFQFPKDIAIKVSGNETNLKLDFTAGKKMIVIARGLPDSAGLDESFVLKTIDFSPDGNETILQEEFGDGVVKLVVDYNLEMTANIRFRYAGNSFRSKIFNAAAASFADGPCCGTPPVNTREGRGVISIHAKVVVNPNIPITTMVSTANNFLKDYNLQIELKSTTSLAAQTQFQVVDLYIPGTTESCISTRTSPEQDDLFKNYRGGVPSNEIAVYFVEATDPAYNGCASFAPGYPSVIVVRTCTVYTLPHELCHVLGLFHVNDNRRLMTGNGTSNIIQLPPDLSEAELNTIWKSPYLKIIK